MSKEPKPHNYYVVYYYMTQQLRLSGSKLNIYAIIAGFSQDGSAKSLTVNYIAKLAGCSRRQAQYALSELQREGLIERQYCQDKTLYRATVLLPGDAVPVHRGAKTAPIGAQKLHRGGEKIAPIGVKKLHPNNNIHNADNNIQLLLSLGIDEATAAELSSEHPAERIGEVVAAAKSASADNPAGWAVSALKRGWLITAPLRPGQVRRRAARSDCDMCHGSGVIQYDVEGEVIERPCPCTAPK